MASKKTVRMGSQGPDVVFLQTLLNTIPQTLLPRLIEDGLFGRKTLERVIEFQRNARLVVDGVVGPQTWGMLDELTKFLLPPGKKDGTDGSAPDAWRKEPFREAALRAGLAEAFPVSKVTDFITTPAESPLSTELPPLGRPPTYRPRQWRFGWPRLKHYYDVAAEGVNDRWWRMTGETNAEGSPQIITNLDGVRGFNLRVPQPNAMSGIHWCGIFATWCWIQAGVKTKWPWGGPPRGITKRWMDKKPPPPKPGDMLVLAKPLIHHFLLLPDDAGPNHYLSLNGNSDYQSITIKRIERSGLVAYYSLEDFANQ